MNAIHWSAVAVLITATTAAAFASSDAATPVAASATAERCSSRIVAIVICQEAPAPSSSNGAGARSARCLPQRTDLPADYVKAVARHGVLSMQPIMRVEVTDEELEKLAAFLATPHKDKAQAGAVSLMRTGLHLV